MPVATAAGGLRWLGRSWFEVLVRPRRFFDRSVVAGDQAPGLGFAMAVVAVEESVRLWLVPGAIPPLTPTPVLSAGLVVAVAVLLVTPVALHLVAAVTTLALRWLVPGRAGISHTVQVVAYSTAPCALAGVPDPGLRLACAAYGAGLLGVGLGRVHGVGGWRVLAVPTVPAAVVFGYGFRGFAAAAALLGRWQAF